MKIRSIIVITAFASAVSAREFHVAISGDDSKFGAKASPFLTIQRAADLAQPGDVITVHAGVYRERINPPRGGTDDAHRITYQAAPGEKVVITGADPVKGWVKVTNDTWKVTLPNSYFGMFNPYADVIRGDWCRNPRGFHVGAVYLDGDWLTEETKLADVLLPVGNNQLWFGEVTNGVTTLWAQFKGLNPNEASVDINVRQTVFTPSKTGIDYLTVRGFELRAAAAPWAPPTAAQIGIISAYWCKGWIIENNNICYSRCCGVALGKYGDGFDNTSANTSEGYVSTVSRALTNGWNRATIGSHIVRNNEISHCEQTGLVGSLGCSFSTVAGNEIHDIHVQRLYSGAEMAGIKFHGAIDVVIGGNHIYRCNRGIWLDWMAQGARVTGNLLHDNAADNVNWSENWEARTPGGEQDMFFEVNHGPILVDNNIFLSSNSLNDRSQGVAFVHNLFAGVFRIVPHDGRKTPYFQPHLTKGMALHDNPCGDHQFYNNLFVGLCDLTGFDTASLPVSMEGNLYFQGAKPSKREAHPYILAEAAHKLQIVQKLDGWYLALVEDKSWRDISKSKLVTTDLLGKAIIPNCAYENPDGSPLKIDSDYFGKKRDKKNLFPGPFENALKGETVKVWPVSSR